MFREVAAYIIDDKFARVPETALGKIRIKFNQVSLNSSSSWSHGYKLCSLQEYIRHECSSEDMGFSLYDADDVHRIAILDIRLANQDRHLGNILVCKNRPYNNDVTSSSSSSSSASKSAPIEYSMEKVDLTKQSQFKLIPIDHGFCLPHILSLNESTFCWLTWPQAKLPVSTLLKDYVRSLDYNKDVSMLKTQIGESIPESSLMTLQVCTMLLQKGIEKGLSLYDIGTLMVTSVDTSPLQEAVNTAIKKTYYEQIRSKSKFCSSNIFRMDHENDKVNTMMSDKDDDVSNNTTRISCDEMLASLYYDKRLTIELSNAIERLVSQKC